MATAIEVISTLQGCGVTLEADGAGGLRVTGISRLSDCEKVTLRAHKNAILRVLGRTPILSGRPVPAPVAPSTATTRPLANRTEPSAPGSTQPFSQRELDAIRNGFGVWVWSGTLEEWLFVVRNEGRKAKAVSRGLEPGCIWTLAEITGVAGMPPRTDPNALQSAFLAGNLGKPVTVFTINDIKLVVKLRQFDQFTLLQVPDGLNSLVFKYAITTIVPAC